MKKSVFLFAVFLVFLTAAGAWAAAGTPDLLKQAVTDLGIDKSTPGVCALTNAPYVSPNGENALSYVDAIQGLTGCSLGKGNLLFFQRPRNSPLLIALSREDSGETVVIKDDAVSTLLDLTPGKQSLYVKNMAEGRATEGPDGRFAGIVVRWNAAEKKGKAAVLQFDWNEAYRLAGITAEDFNPKGGKSNPAFFTVRVRSSWALIPYLGEPEHFIKTFKEADIDDKALARMKQAGTDPYQVVGMAK